MGSLSSKELDAANQTVPSYGNNWLHVNLVLHVCVREALIAILHDENVVGFLPKDTSKLYQRMVQFKAQYQSQLARVLNRAQWERICPSLLTSEYSTENWDITILTVLIQYVVFIPHPIRGWEARQQDSNDISVAAFVCQARNIRNEIIHEIVLSRLENEVLYKNTIARMKTILRGLKYKNMGKVDALKDCKSHLAAVMKFFGTIGPELTEAMKKCDVNEKDIKQQGQIMNEYIVRLQDFRSALNLFKTQNSVLNDSNDEFRRRLLSMENNFSETEENAKVMKESISTVRADLENEKEDRRKSDQAINALFESVRERLSLLESKSFSTDSIIRACDNEYLRLQFKTIIDDILPQSSQEENDPNDNGKLK